MSQRVVMWKRKANSKAPEPKGIFINKNSIGYITVNGERIGYNTHLLAKNTLDFEKDDEFNPFLWNPSKKTIYIRKK